MICKIQIIFILKKYIRRNKNSTILNKNNKLSIEANK